MRCVEGYALPRPPLAQWLEIITLHAGVYFQKILRIRSAVVRVAYTEQALPLFLK